MEVKNIVSEDFSNYKKISMFIGTVSCDWKCCKGKPGVCQNYPMIQEKTFHVSNDAIIQKYADDPLTNAIVIGGLEPFDQFDELNEFVHRIRSVPIYDDIVIYTGYEEDEIRDKLFFLASRQNIIVKFGRYIPDIPSRYDPILGINLASCNQYAKVITYDSIKEPQMVTPEYQEYRKKVQEETEAAAAEIREYRRTHIFNPKISLNHNLAPDALEKLQAAVIANDGYCPCRIKKSEDTKCICKEFREQESGICHCGLYEKIKGVYDDE